MRERGKNGKELSSRKTRGNGIGNGNGRGQGCKLAAFPPRSIDPTTMMTNNGRQQQQINRKISEPRCLPDTLTSCGLFSIFFPIPRFPLGPIVSALSSVHIILSLSLPLRLSKQISNRNQNKYFALPITRAGASSFKDQAVCFERRRQWLRKGKVLVFGIPNSLHSTF